MPTAYSYLRFSRPEQMNGDSERRQLEHSRDWARRHKMPLDESLDLRDLGVSAFHGKNAEPGRALGKFLEAIESGRVRAGDYLILENLDRLSRDDVFDKAMDVVKKIIGAGVNIVSLRTERVYSKESLREIGPLLEMMLELWLANEESAKKSLRLKEAWGNKRANVATKKLTSIAPKWLSYDVKRDCFIPLACRVEVVGQIFRMAADGMGAVAIAKHLNKQKVPTFGRGRYWHESYVKKVLANRAVLGEYQPHSLVNGKRVPIGDPVGGYFPPVITPAQFYRANEAASSRRRTGGPSGDRLTNLFGGLLKDARDRGSLVIVNKGNGPALVSAAAKAGLGHYISFP